MSDQAAAVPKEQFKFELQISNQLAPFTHLKLFNGYNEIVHEGYGSINMQLPKGVYRLRAEINEYVEDRSYRLVSDISDHLSKIETTSAIPAEGLVSTHEYFTNPTVKWSKESTTESAPLNPCSIFVLLRYSDKEKSFDSLQQPEKGFMLLNEKRELLFSFDESNTKLDSGRQEQFFGTVCFSQSVTPGQYYLIYRKSSVKREIPIYVFKDWQTQVFLVIKDVPVFASLRILFDRNGFDELDEQNLPIDALVQKIYNGIYFLPEEVVNRVAQGKWKNPMLGILAEYMYLLTKEKNYDELFKIILANLQGEILHNDSAPDLVALRLLSAMHFEKPLPDTPLEAPCMLALGMTAFLNASLKKDSLIKKGSIVEKIFPNLHCDSIWTTYSPLPIKSTKRNEKSLKSDELEKLTPKGIGTVAAIASKSAKSSLNFMKSWVTSSILNQMAESEQPLSIETLASQMQVTGNTVTSAITKINSAIESNALSETIQKNEMFGENKERAIYNINSQIKNLIK